MITTLRQVVGFTLLMTLLCGVIYPLGFTGLAQLVFPRQAGGSLLLKDGKVIGSALIAQGFSWRWSLALIVLGNLIVLVPMTLVAHAGTKYGVSFPVLCRASFGVKGANTW